MTTGTKVAVKKDKNNKDCVINIGKISFGNKIPTRIDFEKSGLGNNNIPTIKPTIIEI